MGHTYDWQANGSRVDPRLHKLNMNNFDRIWLGGDICSETLLNYSTILYLDSLFHIHRPENHFALGNHDTRNGNLIWLTELMGRESYYAYYADGFTTIVMNTCIVPYDCENLDKQFRMILAVCDTIQQSSHLVVLMHHAIWNNVPNLPSPGNFSHSNFPFWNASCFTLENNSFAEAIYPQLVKVRKKGIEVICICGDMGANRKTFYQASLDSIHFMGCGLDNSRYTDPLELSNQPKDKVLVFEHYPDERTLSWEFQDLDSLLIHQKK